MRAGEWSRNQGKIRERFEEGHAQYSRQTSATWLQGKRTETKRLLHIQSKPKQKKHTDIFYWEL